MIATFGKVTLNALIKQAELLKIKNAVFIEYG